MIPFDEKKNLHSLIVDYQDRKQLAIDLILKAKPFPQPLKPNALQSLLRGSQGA